MRDGAAIVALMEVMVVMIGMVFGCVVMGGEVPVVVVRALGGYGRVVIVPTSDSVCCR